MSVHDAEVSIALLVVTKLLEGSTESSTTATNLFQIPGPRRVTIDYRGRPLSLILKPVPACNVTCCITDPNAERVPAATAFLPEQLCRCLRVPMLHVTDDVSEAEPLVFLDDMKGASSSSMVPQCPNVPSPLMLIRYGDVYLWCELRHRQTPDDCYSPLRDFVTYSPQQLLANKLNLDFVVHQIVSVVQFVLAHALVPVNLVLDAFTIDVRRFHIQVDLMRLLVRSSVPQSDEEPSSVNDYLSRPLWQATTAWTLGRLTNFDYITILNVFAGRNKTDLNNYPIYPWVADFTLSESGWRDLTKTKYRLRKGDAALDQTHDILKNSSHPSHHVPELFSDLSYYNYMARVTEKKTLCQHVRRQWIPGAFPSSMARLYEWTPDECIRELYDDPSVFKSIHDDMPDMELPEWCEGDPITFVKWHLNMLNCDWVAQRLNHWIDLMFGYKLTGEAAIAAKNVHLPASHSHGVGPIQLFHKPHPVYKGKNVLHRTTNGSNVANHDHMNDTVMNPLYDMPQDQNYFGEELQKLDVMTLLNYVYKERFDHASYERTQLMVHSLGALLLELTASHRFRCLPIDPASPEDRIALARQLHSNYIKSAEDAALHLTISQLLRADNAFSQLKPVRVPSKTQITDILQPALNSLQLPFCLTMLSEWLTNDQTLLRRLSAQLCADELNISNLEEITTTRIQCFKEICTQLIPSLIKISGGIDWLFGFAHHLMATRLLSATAIPFLLPLFAENLAKSDVMMKFAGCLRLVYDVDTPCSSQVIMLYDQSFTWLLCQSVGIDRYLSNILHFIVEAASGLRDGQLRSRQQFVVECLFGGDGSQPPSGLCLKSLLAAADTRSDVVSISSGQGQDHDDQEEAFAFEEEQLHTFRPDIADLETRVSTAMTAVPRSISFSPADLAEDVAQSDSFDVEEMGGGISRTAHDTLLRLAHDLGPVLTARYISKTLLRMLLLCYQPPHINQVKPDSTADALSGRILDCLVGIVSTYGVEFILKQYLPYAVHYIEKCSKRLDSQLESGVIGCVVMTECMFQYLSDTQLMDSIQEPLIDSILFPAVRIASSLRFTFHNNRARSVLARKCAQLLAALATRLGADNLRRHMAAPLQRLLCTFDLLYELQPGSTTSVKKRNADQTRTNTGTERLFSSERVLEQLQLAFDDQFASYMFELFVPITGRFYFEQCIANTSLYFALVHSATNNNQVRRSSEVPIGGSSGGPAASLWSTESQRIFGGNKLSSSMSSMSSYLESMMESNQVENRPDHQYRSHMEGSERELKGYWLAHWQHEIGRSEEDHSICFNHIPLMTFRGHKSSVKHLVALGYENSFASCSQDKIVRIWSIYSSGGGQVSSECNFVFKQHKSSITDVCLLESQRHLASTDGTIKIWDPVTCTTCAEYNWPSTKSSMFSRQNSNSNSPGLSSPGSRTIYKVSAFRAPSTLMAVCSKNDSILRLLDVKSGKFTADLKPSIGHVRRVCAANDEKSWVAVAGSSGSIAVMDMRTQKPLFTSKVSDSINLLQRSHDDGSVFSYHSGSDSVFRWSTTTAKANVVSKLPVPSSDATNCILDYDSHVLTVSGNRLRNHSIVDNTPQHMDSKVQSNVIGSGISSMVYLPLNRQFLFGANNGNVQLFC